MLLREFWIVYFPITGCQLYIDLAYGFTTYRTTDGSTILSSELLMESTRFKFQSHFMGEQWAWWGAGRNWRCWTGPQAPCLPSWYSWQDSSLLAQLDLEFKKLKQNLRMKSVLKKEAAEGQEGNRPASGKEARPSWQSMPGSRRKAGCAVRLA